MQIHFGTQWRCMEKQFWGSHQCLPQNAQSCLAHHRCWRYKLHCRKEMRKAESLLEWGSNERRCDRSRGGNNGGDEEKMEKDYANERNEMWWLKARPCSLGWVIRDDEKHESVGVWASLDHANKDVFPTWGDIF